MASRRKRVAGARAGSFRPRSSVAGVRSTTRASGKSAALYLKSSLSSWVTDPDPRHRRETERRLREGVKLVRRLYAGFDPKRGYDLNKLSRWPDSRIEEVSRFISHANRLTSGEYHDLYTVVRPRTNEQREALRLHTSQVSTDEDKHPQKAYVIYANVRDARVDFVEEVTLKGVAFGMPIEERRLRVEIREPVEGGALIHRDYLFREVLGFQPGTESTTEEGLRVAKELGTFDPWGQMSIAMRELLPRLPQRSRNGNEAYYRLITDRGPISVSRPVHMLAQLMEEWGDKYDAGFVETIIGLRYQGDEFRAVVGPASLDSKAEQRRARYRRLAYERRLARSRIDPRGRIGKVPRATKVRVTKSVKKKRPAVKKAAVKKRVVKKKPAVRRHR